MPDLYLHPSVTSFITDESQLFPQAQGLTMLFAPVFAEKGADNVLQTVDSAAEYIEKYGEPNSVLYGQAPLQTVEWVKAGGQAVVMRLLPEDACLAHAIIDFQTKSGDEVAVQSWEYTYTSTGGEVVKIPIIRKEDPTRPGTFMFEAAANPSKGFAGRIFRTNLRTGETAEDQLIAALGPGSSETDYAEPVEQPIVLLRPQIKRAPAGVATRDALAAWARALHGNGSSLTADGFVHNVYGFFLPKGRGSKYYNDLEFKISGTDQYDDTYAFRVFTIEIYQRLASGQMKHLDGPFTVSFDPAAVDLAQQSLFIGDVLKEWGKEIDFELLASADITDPTDESEPNWLGFESIAERLCGGLVDPGLIDPFFLQERSLASGATNYHRLNTLTGGVTALAASASAGDTAIYVQNPAILWPGCSISINGRESIVVPDLPTSIDIVTGKVTVPSLAEDLDVDHGVVVVSAPVETIEAEAMLLDIDAPDPRDPSGHTPYNPNVLVFNDPGQGGVPLPGTGASRIYYSDTAEPRFAMERPGVNTGQAVIQIWTDGENGADPTLDSSTPVILESMSAVEDDVQYIEFRTVDGAAFVQPDSTAVTKFMILRQYSTFDVNGTFTMDFDSNVKLKQGTDGRIDSALQLIDPMTGLVYNPVKEKNNLLIRAYTGLVNADVMLKRWWPFDVILDANYNGAVKAAMNQMAAVMRGDLVYVADLGITANPAQAIERRDRDAQFSDFYTSIFAQDYVVYDVYAGKRVRVTTPYFCAQKIPYVDRNFGIHWPFVGARRGVISGFTYMSWNPNDNWQERLYKRQINFAKRDPKRTMLFGQLTSQTVVSAMSDLSHVRALLRIQRDVEVMMEDYQFEFINSTTLNAANSALNSYLQGWVENGCCTELKGTVYSSAYDRKQKTGRVRIEVWFTAILERIVINLVVKG
jgi:hypothetical protein